MSNSTWDLIHAERRQLLADLEHLTEDQWRTRSLCRSWNVHQMLGHVLALTKQTPPAFFGKFIAAGFRFDAMVAKDVARQSAGTPGETMAELAAHAGDTHPLPGGRLLARRDRRTWRRYPPTPRYRLQSSCRDHPAGRRLLQDPEPVDRREEAITGSADRDRHDWRHGTGTRQARRCRWCRR